MAFKHLTVIVVAMVYAFVQTSEVGAKTVKPYVNEEVDPEIMGAYDVGIIPLEGGGQAFVDVDVNDTDDDSTEPYSNFAGMSTGVETEPGAYMYHLERFIKAPEVQYYIAEVKAKYRAYAFQLRAEMDLDKENGEDKPKYENEESVAAAEIQLEFHQCVERMYENGVLRVSAFRCCGKQLWKNAKQRLALMEASLQEYRMNG